MKKLAQILREKRAAMNLSLRSAAELIGISHTYLDKLEKGIDSRTGVSNKPTPDTLKLISEAYNLDYNDLLKMCRYIPIGNEVVPKCYSSDIKELIGIAETFTKPQIQNLILYAKFLKQNGKEFD
ncbi:helix-turn-helix domain-containing protein [uncultured Anaerovibrio sp.]|uniref:helix-turn-helix domain-containing protein n=1 Tax=uncultured Anaerovibrio sp. TaxID=361586 RepID=UPI00262B4725|nr:helix-turn-helix transcriptional regulator [uncultured Anaerovibrio sp.]